MSSKVQNLNDALAISQRSAIIEQLRAHTELTIDDLLRLREVQGDSVGGITVGELIRGKAAKQASRSAAGRRRKTGRRKSGRPKSTRTTRRGRRKAVDTRTAEGRESYDAAVLACVKAVKDEVAAEEVMAQVGGSGDQVRRSLARLTEGKQVKRTGRGRGTKYRAR